MTLEKAVQRRDKAIANALRIFNESLDRISERYDRDVLNVPDSDRITRGWGAKLRAELDRVLPIGVEIGAEKIAASLGCRFRDISGPLMMLAGQNIIRRRAINPNYMVYSRS